MRNDPIASVRSLGSRRPLARRVAVTILVLSGILTLAFTALQLALDYRFEMAQARAALARLEAERLAPLRLSAWVLDLRMIEVQLETLVSTDTVAYAELELADGRVFKSGTPARPGSDLQRVVDLTQDVDDGTVRLGTVRLEASLEPAKARIVNRIGVILATQAVKALLAALVILLVLDRLVGRRLDGIVRSLGATPDAPLRRGHDELDAVEGAIRDAQARLAAETEETARWRQIHLESRRLETVGRIAAGVAHDLNNVFQAMAFQLRSASDKVSDPAALERLARCEDSIGRATTLVRQIVQASRASTAQATRVSLGRLAHEVEVLVAASVPKGVEIKIERDGDDTVPGDAAQLMQMLLNLCLNALHALRTRGTLLEIRIATPPDAPDCREIVVRDDGPGMPPDVVERLFEPFFTTKAPGEGTGLGLPIARGVVEAHHGTIHVDSALGRGTTFVIRLPCSSTPPPLDAAPESPRAAPPR